MCLCVVTGLSCRWRIERRARNARIDELEAALEMRDALEGKYRASKGAIISLGSGDRLNVSVGAECLTITSSHATLLEIL